MFIDGSIHQLPDIDRAETAEWLDSLDAVIDSAGKSRAHYLLARLMERARDKGVGVPADGADRLHQHDPARAGAVVPGRRVRRAPHPRVHPLERGGDGRPRQPPLRRSRRSPLHLRVGGVAVRGRLQPLLPRQGRRPLRRPGVLPGPRRAGHLRARVPRRPADRGPARSVPARGRRRRPAVVPAPAAHAGLLGVPDRVDGARPDQRGVPGALQPLPLQPRDRRHVERDACGASSATASSTSPKSMAALSARRARAPRQPDLRRELQPATARRSGARQRQGHPGARVDRSAAWGGTSIKVDLGHGLGRPARARRRRRARQQDELDRRRRVPEVRGRVRRVHPRALLRTRSAPAQDGASTSATTSCSGSRAAGTTTGSSTPRTRPRSSTTARRRSSSPRR